jgi:dephospho-CoA kinase
MRIGLTGGICSGKSTAADILQSLGRVSYIDTDTIALELCSPNGKAIASIISDFGNTFIAPDGSLNRAMMRALILQDQTAKSRLEAILHPMIREEALAKLTSDNSKNLQLIAIPLLAETWPSWQANIDQVLILNCDPDTQINRLLARSHLTTEQARAWLEQQYTHQQRLDTLSSLPCHVVMNSGNTSELKEALTKIHRYYVELIDKNPTNIIKSQ